MTAKTQASEVRPSGPIALIVLAGLTLALAIFQWIELVIVREGGRSVCSINAQVNCETVWNSPLASRFHELLGVPVAGLGAVWSAAALGLSIWLLLAARKGQVRKAIVPVRLTAIVGVLSCITFAIGSMRAGSLCLLCLTTYVLVLAFAIVSYTRLPGPFALAPGELVPAAGRALGAALVAYLVALYPGLITPHANRGDKVLAHAIDSSSSQAQSNAGASNVNAMLEQFFAGLPQEYQQAVSDSIALWKRAGVVPQNFAQRELEGSLNAPVKVVEFTDIKCPHCKHFLESMNEVKAHLPPGSLSVESRYFPLDAECNQDIPPNFSDHTGVRCLGAKVQICLETQPDFLKLREALFAAQNTLTTDSIMDIGSSGSMSRKDLEACVQSPATAKKLADDVQYATLYHAEGTPLVLVNGRDATPMVEFIYALALAGGDTSLPAFSKLPPPSQQAVQ